MDLGAVYRTQARRVLATLVRLLGELDAAEEALHDAFVAAAEQWPFEGIPANPYAWLVSTGRFKTLDRWRRRARLEDATPELLRRWQPEPFEPGPLADDELRLIFTCCHPALPADARVALTLREVGGLTTEEIARAYLVPAPTIAQRIVRAKAKIRDDELPYEVPERSEWDARLESVLQVVYLIFNEGYASTSGITLVRDDLCAEAIRLGHLVAELVDDSEALGLVALMQLHHARVKARVDAEGELVLLEHQDRTLWDRAGIDAARALIERALQSRRAGPYLLQAAIASVHADAANADETDWLQIVGLYDVLARVAPSPVVFLNRAVAVAMRDGAATGLALVESMLEDGALAGYHLAHAARADLQRRVGRLDAARSSYERALELVAQPAERRFLQRRLAELATRATPDAGFEEGISGAKELR